MALPLITAAVALFYLGAVPLQIAVRYKSGVGFGFGVAPFEARFAHTRALKPRKKSPAISSKLDKTALLRAGKNALRHLHVQSVVLNGSFGCSDAAMTALVCGGVCSLGCALRSYTPHVFVNLRPDFNASQLEADVSGMICVRVGHIIFAALSGLYEYSSGRLNPWTSTPSKAL